MFSIKKFLNLEHKICKKEIELTKIRRRKLVMTINPLLKGKRLQFIHNNI